MGRIKGSKITCVFLTAERKNIIWKFKKLDVENPGSGIWCQKLFEFMVKKGDKEVTPRDITRWVCRYPWITNSDSREGRPTRNMNQPQEASALNQSSSRSAGTNQGTLNSEEQMPMNELRNDGNHCHWNQESTQANASMQCPSHDPPSTQASSTDQPFPSTSAAGSFVNPPTSAFPQNSTPYTFTEGETVSVEDQKLLTEENYRLAFKAINILCEVCDQMLPVQSCLLPLKDIHRCFVRSHANFVFPQEYKTVRSRVEETREVMKREPAQGDYNNLTEVISVDND